MYGRRLDEQSLTLSASGWTYDNVFVLYDYESGSMWHHVDDHLVAIGGPHSGQTLATVTSTTEPFETFLERNPNALYLDYP